jgi:hypothetical protein
MTENPYRPPTAESRALLDARNWDHSQKSRIVDALQILGWFYLYFLGMSVVSLALGFLAAAIRFLIS